MKNIGQLLIGLIVAAGVGLFVLSGISLALVEGGIQVAAVPTLAPSPTVPDATPAPGQTIAPTQAQPRVMTQTPTQVQPTLCPAPAGWEAYTVMGGDNLETLAQLTGATTEQILQGNCLVSSSLLPGTVLYLPRIIQPTTTFTFVPPTARPCGPPPNWVRYTVQPGDTLFRISQSVGVSVYQLQVANCLSGTLITAGTRLFVPFLPPTRTPQPTSTPQLPTSTPTTGTTITVVPPTMTSTSETPQVTITPSVTPTPTNTVEPTQAPPTETPTEEPPTATPEVVDPGSTAPEMPATTEPAP